MRGPLHKLLHVSNAREGILNNALVLHREARLPTQLLDVIAISFRTRHAPGGGVRLLEKPRIGQVRHHVPDRGRTQALAAGAREGARADGFPGGDESLDDCGQDFPFPLTCWS